jgi:hypothetical protein
MRLQSIVMGAGLALAGCGGGGGGGASAPGAGGTPPPVHLQFYEPLALGDQWSYTCRDIKGGGENGGQPFTIVDSVAGTATVNGTTVYEFALQIPQVPSKPLQIVTEIQLLANDAAGNATLYGYLVNGVVTTIKPTLFVTANPPGQQREAFNYPGQNGVTIDREFVGLEPSNPTPLGVFEVAPYFESGSTHNYGYALGTGIVEEDHGPNFEVDCLITAGTLH